MNSQQLRDAQRLKVPTYSKTFNLKFFHSTNKRDRLAKRLPQKSIDFLDKVIPVLQDIYPDNWDIQFRLNYTTKTSTNDYGSASTRALQYREIDKIILSPNMDLIIHFPELTITNSKDDSLQIKDLFVRIRISSSSTSSRFILEDIEGTRATVTLQEFLAGYFHSHLSSIAAYKSTGFYTCEGDKSIFSTFCTGSGQEIDLARAVANEKFDIDQLKLFLLQLNNYVKWESIEGGPHIRMENIVNKTKRIPEVDYYIADAAYTSILSKIRTTPAILDNLNWRFFNNSYQVVDDDNFEQLLVSCINDINALKQFILFKDEKGEYYNDTNIRPENIEKAHNTWIPFRGEKVFFKVEGDMSSKLNRTKYLHPKIKFYVKRQFEQTVNSSNIREIGISRLSESSST